jgi:hypothetical protein
MSNFVYDSLYEPSRQVKNRNHNGGVRISAGGGARRVPNLRADPGQGYFECQLKPKTGDNAESGFPSKAECEGAQICIGPGKAYGYVCGATAVEKTLGGRGYATAEETKCYGCAVKGADGSLGLVYDNDRGQVSGTCMYQAGGETNPKLFTTTETCEADPSAKCGWTFACKS